MTFTNKKRKNSQTEAKRRNRSFVGYLGNAAAYRYLLVTSLLCVHYESAGSVLVQRPKDAIVIANHSTFFNCSKSTDNNSSIDSQELTWYHRPLDGVYEHGRIRDKYQGRFSIDKDLATGRFNLLVGRPEPKDSGKYECVEDVLEDKGASAELIVLDSNLHCESNKDLNEIVGHTECANPIAPDELQLTCSVTYSGNIRPQMEWKKVGSELLSNKTECGERDKRVMCNATVESDHNMVGSVYACQVITAEQYNCSLKVNKIIIYTFSDTSVRGIATTEEVSCSANTSVDLPCWYKWNNDNRTVKSGQTLKPNKSGIYRCEAECKIRNEICAFTAMVINASESANIVTDTQNLKMLWLLVLIPLVLIVAALAFYIRKKDGCRASAEHSSEPLLNLQNGSDDAIENAFQISPFINRGLSGGEIRGPMHYKNMQCLCERIKRTRPTGEQIQAKEEEITKEILSNYGRWKALGHNNLIKFYDLIEKSQDIFIMMEYAAGGSVRNATKKCAESKVTLGMLVIKDWATQIAQGMKYLHERSIVYKNLDSFRILIMESFEASNITNKTLKICQFCLIDDHLSKTDGKQNFSFTAPEVFDGTYDKPGDAWSFGIVIWEMLTGRIPYNDVKAIAKITTDIRQGATVLKIPDPCPKALEEILMGCRRINAGERPSFTEILQSLQAWQPVSLPS